LPSISPSSSLPVEASSKECCFIEKQVLLIVLTMKTLSKSLNINRTVYCQNTNKQEYRWFTLIQGLQYGYLKETSVVRYFSRDTMYITLSKSIYEIMQTKIVSIKRAEHGKWKRKCEYKDLDTQNDISNHYPTEGNQRASFFQSKIS
jgi:hypothetical protein